MEKDGVPVIISASRRCDLPRFHWPWLKESLQRQTATVLQPYGRRKEVALGPSSVHSLVLWSKDFAPLLKDSQSYPLLNSYSLYFMFTITGLGGSSVEPGVPTARESLKQVSEIAARYGPQRVAWRYDPVVRWREQGRAYGNFELFSQLCQEVSALGIRRCVTSFVQPYAKLDRRQRRYGIELAFASREEVAAVAAEMASVAACWRIDLEHCAPGSESSSSVLDGTRGCINAELLEGLHPEKLRISPEKDRGQRPSCNCARSTDIGSYSLPCPPSGRCLYCYAAP